MRRICAYCQKSLGEKCGHCGSLEVVKLPGGWLCGWRLYCRVCRLTWKAGDDRPTHTVCESCLENMRNAATSSKFNM